MTSRQYTNFVKKCKKNYDVYENIYIRDLLQEQDKKTHNISLLHKQISIITQEINLINSKIFTLEFKKKYEKVENLTKVKKNKTRKLNNLKNRLKKLKKTGKFQPNRPNQKNNKRLTCGRTIQDINMIDDDEIMESKDEKSHIDPSITQDEINMISIPLFTSNRRKWGMPFGILLDHIKLTLDPKYNIGITLRYLINCSMFFIPKKRLIQEFGKNVGQNINRVHIINIIINGPNREKFMEEIKKKVINILRNKGLDSHIQTCSDPRCDFHNEPFLVENTKTFECPNRHNFCSNCKKIVTNEHFCTDSNNDANETNYIIYMDKLSGDSNNCPRCKYFQNRYVGCDHLNCILCRTSFCVGCGDNVSNHDYVETHMVNENNQFRCFKRYLNNCLYGFHSIEDIRNIAKIYQYVTSQFPQYLTATHYDLEQLKENEGKKLWEQFISNEKNVSKVALTKIKDDNEVIRKNGREILLDQKNRLAKYLAVLNRTDHEEIHEELIALISI